MKRKLLYLLLPALVMIGCAIKKPNGQPASPYERALVYNDVLAQTNKNIGEGIMLVSPSPTVPLAKARAILAAQKKVAQADIMLTTILKQGQVAAATHSADISAILDELRADATEMVDAGIVGVKNPQSQQLFDADINAVGSLIATLVDQLKLLEVIH